MTSTGRVVNYRRMWIAALEFRPTDLESSDYLARVPEGDRRRPGGGSGRAARRRGCWGSRWWRLSGWPFPLAIWDNLGWIWICWQMNDKCNKVNILNVRICFKSKPNFGHWCIPLGRSGPGWSSGPKPGSRFRRPTRRPAVLQPPAHGQTIVNMMQPKSFCMQHAKIEVELRTLYTKWRELSNSWVDRLT